MSQTAENNQYYKGKLPIIEEFSNQHRTLLSTVAGRGFCKIPGFLYEASLTLEETGKNKLSALNYAIVAEAVKRELTQTGHTYTQAYKASRIAFELEKQTLLTALQQEFSDLDATQSLKKEELDRLFVELDIRRIILITTKTTIELQMEALKQELADIDRLTFTNEELLINEKIATATAKLAVIPYLEALIAAQEKILAAEEANIPLIEGLIDEKELLIEKKLEIIPLLENKATEQTKLAAVLYDQIEFQKQTLTAIIEKILLKKDVVDNKIAILDAEILVEDMRQLLLDEKHDLQEDKLVNFKTLLDKDVSALGLIATQRNEMLTALQDDKVSINSDNKNTETTITDKDLRAAKTDNNTSVDAEKLTINETAGFQAEATKDTAEAAAKAKITSELIHLIGS